MAHQNLHKVVVIGGSPAALTAASLLQRRCPSAAVTVINHNEKWGGSSAATRRSKSGLIYESGIHHGITTNNRGREALGFFKMLGLESEIIPADINSSSAKRFQMHKKSKVGLQTKRVPSFSDCLRLIGPVILEPLWPRCRQNDESVFDFVTRRSTAGFAERWAIPACWWMFGGDARQLSIRSCFPRVWNNEQKFSSVFCGGAFDIMRQTRERSWMCLDTFDPLLMRIVAQGGRLYSFTDGVSTFVDRIVEHFDREDIGNKVEMIEQAVASFDEKKVVLADGRELDADVVLSALPSPALANLLRDDTVFDKSIKHILHAIPHDSVTVVNVIFEKPEKMDKTFWCKGYGYTATPPHAGNWQDSNILGASFDSNLFPRQDEFSDEKLMRATFYVKSKDPIHSEKIVLNSLQSFDPNFTATEVITNLHTNSLPQYVTGHEERFTKLKSILPDWFQVLGRSYEGVALADEIVSARRAVDLVSEKLVNKWRREHASKTEPSEKTGIFTPGLA